MFALVIIRNQVYNILLRFVQTDIFVERCVVGYFFPDTVYTGCLVPITLAR